VIHRALQHTALAQTACAIGATERQVVAMFLRSFDDGFASFGGKSVIARLERDVKSHVVF
jgi:hypothetical protein